MELVEGKEYWIKAKFLTDDNSFFKPLLFEFKEGVDGTSWIERNIEAVEAIPVREKVTIPNFVAEWIEETKRFYNLYGTMGRIRDNLAPSEIIKWFDTNPTLTGEIFARAWLDGYEIEKEPLYYVKIPNVYHGYFGYSERFDNYSFYNKEDATEIRFELTEEEIKQNHEWAWQFAKPVEEE